MNRKKERWQSWSNAPDLKSGETLRFPWVRIPLSPIKFFEYKKVEMFIFKAIKNNSLIRNF
jgi:hypothetical protein